MSTVGTDQSRINYPMKVTWHVK